MLFNCYVSDILILRSDCMQDLGVMLNSTLRFHRQVGCVCYHAPKALVLIPYITRNFYCFSVRCCSKVKAILCL
jgi:hypothetical protein